MTRIGEALDRIEGTTKVCGTARYAADHLLLDLHAAIIVPACIAAGQITRIDTSEAVTAPGVVAVLDHRNAPRLKPVATFPRGPAGESLLPLQDTQILYAGQAVALVVARTIEQAEYAGSLVRVSYSEMPARTLERYLRAGERPEELPEEARQRLDSTRGDVDSAFGTAEVVVNQIYETPSHHQTAMEPHGTTAYWRDNFLTLYESTQWVLGARRTVATMLGLKLDQVRVIADAVGGGFGGKSFTWTHPALAAVAAMHTRVPIRLTLSREQTFFSCGYRSATRQHLRLGATRDGRLVAIDHTADSQTSIRDLFVKPTGELSEMLYACANVRTRHRAYRVNTVTPTHMRAPAESVGSFALESAMDELAAALGIDPLELRLRNFAETHPHLPWSSNGLRECYRLGAAAFRWDQRPLSGWADGDYQMGWGMAACAYGCYRSQAEVTIRADAAGHLHVSCATHDIGTGTPTIMAQITADILNVPVSAVEVHLGDTYLPAAPVHGASRNTASIAPAVAVAARALRAKLASYGYGAIGVTITEAVRHSGSDEVSVTARSGPAELTDADFAKIAGGLNSYRTPVSGPAAMYSFGAHFAEVRVHRELGTVHVTRLTSRFDVGRVINPKGAHSQALGGLVFGIGAALMEEAVTDPVTGRLVSASLADYHVAAHADMPIFDIGFVQTDDSLTNEFGTKGLGELAVVGSAGAIANAVYHATGRRVRSLPLTPDRVLAAPANRTAVTLMEQKGD